MSFRLQITTGKGAGKDFYFNQKLVRIGRLPDNDLVLYDTAVSRHHCEIVRDGTSYLVRDKGSGNGTFVNEVMTREASISSGDKIQLGPVVFEFTLVESPVRHDVNFAVEATSEQGAAFEPTSDTDRNRMETSSTQSISREEALSYVSSERGDSGSYGSGDYGRRTNTGSFLSYRMTRPFWMRFPTSGRFSVFALAAVIAAAIVGATLWVRLHPPPEDESGKSFRLSAAESGVSFGNISRSTGAVTHYTPDKVTFLFESRQGRVTVSYAAGGIDSAEELAVLVNGRRVGFVDPSPGRWSRGLELIIPRRFLVLGNNQLTFDNTLTPASDEPWGVANIAITEIPLPEPDQKRANELFETGRSSYDARDEASANLFHAITHLANARLYLEGFSEPPGLLESIAALESLARRELEQIHASHIFAAEKAVRLGERKMAEDKLRALLKYYPDSEDEVHKELLGRLARVAGKQY